MNRKGHGLFGYLKAPTIPGTYGDTRIVACGSLDSFLRDWYAYGADRREREHAVEASRDWYGIPAGARFRDMKDLPYRPDAAALAAIDEMKAAISASIPAPVDRRRRPRWSEDHGDEMDMDRLRYGAPYWRETARVNTAGPAQVTLVSQIGGACSARARDLLWTPSACLALADGLESAGYRVRICTGYHGGTCWQRSGDHLTVLVTVKDFGDPLSLQMLSACATPWFFRHHVLAIMDALGKPTGGYGNVGMLTKERALAALGEEDNGAFHVIGRSPYPSRDSAISEARALLRGMFPDEVPA